VPAVAIVLDLPVGVVLARNAARDGGARVPDDAVRTQLAALAAAQAGEQAHAWAGFDAVHRLHSPDDVDRVVIARQPTG
jgi:hypothetical protein